LTFLLPQELIRGVRRRGNPLRDDEGGGWVQLVRDGYVGYIAMAALAEGRSAPTHRVTVNRTLISVLT
jgi:hypothetical protein